MLYAIILSFALALVILGALSSHRSATAENVSGIFARAGRNIGSVEMSRQAYTTALPLR